MPETRGASLAELDGAMVLPSVSQLDEKAGFDSSLQAMGNGKTAAAWKMNYAYYVYVVFAEEVNRIKVGVSRSPLQRLASLGTNSPCQLRTLFICRTLGDLEHIVHALLREWRYQGEWFDYTPQCQALLASWMMSNSTVVYPSTTASDFDPDEVEVATHNLRFTVCQNRRSPCFGRAVAWVGDQRVCRACWRRRMEESESTYESENGYDRQKTHPKLR